MEYFDSDVETNNDEITAPYRPVQTDFHIVRQLIRDGQLDDAHTLLREMDHPRAQEWLAKLEVKMAQRQQTAPQPRRKPSLLQRLLAFFRRR